MATIRSWTVSDALWERVEPLIPRRKRQKVFVTLWRKGLAEYDELEGIAWAWQSIDGARVKAPLALESVGPNPTDRGKKARSAASSSTRMESRCPWS